MNLSIQNSSKATNDRQFISSVRFSCVFELHFGWHSILNHFRYANMMKPEICVFHISESKRKRKKACPHTTPHQTNKWNDTKRKTMQQQWNTQDEYEKMCVVVCVYGSLMHGHTRSILIEKFFKHFHFQLAHVPLFTEMKITLK